MHRLRAEKANDPEAQGQARKADDEAMPLYDSQLARDAFCVL